jgi:dienelactone hydrolase
MPSSVQEEDGMSREHLTTLGETPALVVCAGRESAAVKRGTVLVLHGLGGSKERQRPEAGSLAGRGYLAIALDAVGHGARRYPDFEDRFAPDRAELSFFEVVQRTAEELPSVLEALARRGWTRPGRLGACGISMGGAVLFGASTRSCTFNAVATIVASPRWRHTEDSPHERLDCYYPTPLLMQTAGSDTTVGPCDARDLHLALLPRYASSPDRLRYVEHTNEEHLLSEPAWTRAWNSVLEWFERFLKPPRG